MIPLKSKTSLHSQYYSNLVSLFSQYTKKRNVRAEIFRKFKINETIKCCILFHSTLATTTILIKNFFNIS